MKIVAITPVNKSDETASLIIEGMNDLGVEVFASDLGNGIKKSYSEDEIVAHAEDADYVFVFFGKASDKRWTRSPGQKPPRHYLLDRINDKEKTVYIDGSEWTATGHPDNYDQVCVDSLGKLSIHKQAAEALVDPSRYRGEPWINEEMYEKCQWYFKRECYLKDLERGIIPLPFGFRNEYTPASQIEKDIDISCFFGQIYTGLRNEVLGHCNRLRLEKGYTVRIDDRISKKTYRDLISRSLISISSWGAGNCCMREWEIMGLKTCCFVQRHHIVIPEKPVDGTHWVEYSTIQELSDKINFYLKNPDLCYKIGQQGFDYAINRHTGKDRVRYIFDTLKSTRKVNNEYQQ